ncbi:MAG TPA: hypothetical protein VMD99_06325 [Terriglobales bacterium]|nr:hypothetical protein [Terriglobales bacterium]HTZ81633.1 hypothetical protein [Candidatus Acidoferrales bacterium]
MKEFFPILFLVCTAGWSAWGQARPVATAPIAHSPTPAKSTAEASPALVDKDAIENAAKAKSIIELGIKALGGDTYLTIRDREMQGRGYGFHAGRPTGSGGLFWSFSEFPDKERVELTKERDIAELYVGDRAWEITYKGAHPIEQKDLDDYLRRRRFSLDTVLRTWVNDPGVILLFNGNAIAAQHSAYSVTLVNVKNESVTLYFDTDTHLPVKKTFEWRDPLDRQKNLEEEIYDDYKAVSGIMAPFNLTRYFNGDMASQRFLNVVTINQGLDPAMFNPNSGYNPNKPEKSKRH